MNVFAARPARVDFEAQLARSLRDVGHARGAVIFDRSPADFLAYLLAHRDATDRHTGRVDVAQWLPDVRAAVDTLDSAVFVPLERPDRIAAADADRLRRRVDAALRAGLAEDG